MQMAIFDTVSKVRSCAVTVAVAAALITPAAAQTVSIGTTAAGSQGAAMGAALARVIDGEGLNVRAVPLGGPEVSLPLLARGELEFAIVSADAASLSTTGTAVFEGRQTPDMRMVAHLLPFTVGWFVRADSEFKSLADLKGAKVPWGFAQQRILGLWGEAQLAAAGVEPDDVEQVQTTSAPNSVQDFMAGRVDAGLFTVGSGLVSQADASVGGIRYLSLPTDSEKVTSDLVPGTSVTTLKPRENLPGIDGPTDLMQSTLVLVTSKDVDPAIIEKVLKAIYDGKGELRSILPAFAQFDTETMNVPVANMSYHPAAQAFYESVGLDAE